MSSGATEEMSSVAKEEMSSAATEEMSSVATGLIVVAMDRHGTILWENEATGSRKVFRCLLELWGMIFCGLFLYGFGGMSGAIRINKTSQIPAKQFLRFWRGWALQES